MQYAAIASPHHIDRHRQSITTMHNRRVPPSKSTTSLPLYNSGTGSVVVVSPDPVDLVNNKPSTTANRSSSVRQSFRPTQAQIQNLYKSLIITITIVIFFTFIVYDLPIEDEEDEEMAMRNKRRKLIQQFPSLEYPLDHSSLVGLYFAASWCPMSTPVTKKLDELFRDVTLKPPLPPPPSKIDNVEVDTNQQQQQQEVRRIERKDLSIVYISSDLDAQSMESYVKPNWFTVPFENVTERSALKQHYKTCAKRELAELGFDRKHEIPTLIILSSETHDVLTYNGINDINENGVDAIDHWLEILRLTKAWGEKYSQHH